jgi:hypothetical protein
MHCISSSGSSRGALNGARVTCNRKWHLWHPIARCSSASCHFAVPRNRAKSPCGMTVDYFVVVKGSNGGWQAPVPCWFGVPRSCCHLHHAAVFSIAAYGMLPIGCSSGHDPAHELQVEGRKF